ncbi:ribosomal-protein-alanine acetyltransferase [Desulfosporosinus orientis DSM 765]|uniref:[Ribosomal protein bS18]-alanine N-acetyltransferase n=1 Tax=Desulfosporosinus orientis (strain ATCC 19365 / DSM 765 / NCIMB 8382 / VKM B-1628 / Singapore I) TaxID=768706 RepID=G7W5C1_DESOD|nr:ribosomal protein S18-alanine N-acetyltransferase [Desulfosporosinus orientis]AET66349.1 ribosomal-protein-alanine acetyltransferase [Desulfosporosinus orientis DSM 765]
MNEGKVRPMRMDDLEAIMEIEVSSFSTPWSLQAFKAELKDNEYARYTVLEVEGKVVGYMGLWFILDEGHITNVAIAPNFRGKHWGEFLMRSVMVKMIEEGMERMTLEVRASNSPAQSLYSRLGFKTAGIRKGYYADTGEDALIMWVDLGMEVNRA